MKMNIVIATLCVSLMLITPFTVVAQENKVSNNLSEQPDVKGLVAQLRVVINEILQKYGHNLMVSNLCNLILSLSNIIGKIIFCISLLIITIFLVILLIITIGLEIQVWEQLSVILLVTMMTYDRNCPPSTPLNNLLSPLKSIYTLSETNDISELVNDCPCL